MIEQILQYMQHEYILNPEQYPEMQEAGLVGQQLQTKLESFEFSLSQFAEDGGVENLEDALDKGRTILNSLAGAVPGFGSFAQELVDFILKELKRRFRI
ncbi:MAG: hypothetical protein U5O39_10880 [Gammaproteobacteria bacterium]|nr:hypothetical protein [Gammaproteobacteria bacterium]